VLSLFVFAAGCSSAGKVNDAFDRVDRLSRKLQRRLTKRTLAEARAFRKHGIDTLHTLLQFAQLVSALNCMRNMILLVRY